MESLHWRHPIHLYVYQNLNQSWFKLNSKLPKQNQNMKAHPAWEANVLVMVRHWMSEKVPTYGLSVHAGIQHTFVDQNLIWITQVKIWKLIVYTRSLVENPTIAVQWYQSSIRLRIMIGTNQWYLDRSFHNVKSIEWKMAINNRSATTMNTMYTIVYNTILQ